MAKIKLIGAQSPENLAYHGPEGFFVRSVHRPDNPIAWDQDPDLFRAALFAKWGFLPVIGQDGQYDAEMDAGQVAVIESAEMPDGDDGFKVVDVVDYEDGGDDGGSDNGGPQGKSGPRWALSKSFAEFRIAQHLGIVTKGGITKIITDKLGRKRKYVDGKQVPMNEAKPATAKQPKPPTAKQQAAAAKKEVGGAQKQAAAAQKAHAAAQKKHDSHAKKHATAHGKHETAKVKLAAAQEAHGKARTEKQKAAASKRLQTATNAHAKTKLERDAAARLLKAHKAALAMAQHHADTTAKAHADVVAKHGAKEAPKVEDKPVGANKPKRDTAKWTNSVMDAVMDAVKASASSPNGAALPSLAKIAKENGATIGQFHDEVRKLAAEGKIELKPWTKPIHQIQDEDNAIIDDQEIKYFAKPGTGEKKPTVNRFPRTNPNVKFEDWGGKVADFVKEYEQSHPNQFAPLPDIYRATAGKAGASSGDFVDGIRKLAKDGAIQMHPYTRPPYTMEDGDLAFVASGQTQYYAQASHKKEKPKAAGSPPNGGGLDEFGFPIDEQKSAEQKPATAKPKPPAQAARRAMERRKKR